MYCNKKELLSKQEFMDVKTKCFCSNGAPSHPTDQWHRPVEPSSVQNTQESGLS